MRTGHDCQQTDQIRLKVPKFANIIDEAEHDVLANMYFPIKHRAKLHIAPSAPRRRFPSRGGRRTTT